MLAWLAVNALYLKAAVVNAGIEARIIERRVAVPGPCFQSMFEKLVAVPRPRAFFMEKPHLGDSHLQFRSAG